MLYEINLVWFCIRTWLNNEANTLLKNVLKLTATGGDGTRRENASVSRPRKYLIIQDWGGAYEIV